MEQDQSKTETLAAVRSSDLLACPFCGGTDIERAPRRGFPVQCECKTCRSEGPAKLTSEEAVESWNGRATTTPNAKLPPLGEGPRRKMIIEIEVTEDFEKRLDNQWMVEREIHADRWNWRWAGQANE